MLDGEICILGRGISNFVLLHERAKRRRWYPGAAPVVFCAFDLLVHGGQDVRGLPIEERKARLGRVLGAALVGVLLVTGIPDGRATRAAVETLHLEGRCRQTRRQPVRVRPFPGLAQDQAPRRHAARLQT